MHISAMASLCNALGCLYTYSEVREVPFPQALVQTSSML